MLASRRVDVGVICMRNTMLASVSVGTLIATMGLAYAGDVTDWSGWYVGGALSVGSINNDSVGNEPYHYDESLLGALVTAGFNWQNGALVYGIQGDIGLVSHGEAKGSYFNGSELGDGYETTQSPVATLQARLGYATGSLLFYGTAGVSVSSIEVNDSGSDNLFGAAVVSPVLGAGVELAVSETLSVKAEARLSRTVLESDTYTTTVNSAVGLVGVNFHF